MSTAPWPTRESASISVGEYLHSGHLRVSAQPMRITTILGSSVSVCLFDTQRRVGGLNHYLLPHTPATFARSARYGDVAIDMLLCRLLALGATREGTVAKLFGGANVLQAFPAGASHIGAANVELARELLARNGIPIGAEDVGGARVRKLDFSAPDGAAWVRMLGP